MAASTEAVPEFMMPKEGLAMPKPMKMMLPVSADPKRLLILLRDDMMKHPNIPRGWIIDLNQSIHLIERLMEEKHQV